MGTVHSLKLAISDQRPARQQPAISLQQPRMSTTIDVLLQENRKFAPPESFKRQAHVRDGSEYEKAAADYEAYWAEQARALEWIRPWTTVLEWKPPRAKWFIGGQLNVSQNCLDRHIGTARR